MTRARWGLAAAAFVLLAGGACATLQQIAALRRVDFALDRVSDVRVAGIDVSRVRSYDDIGVIDAGRLALEVAQRRLPLDMQVHLRAENPDDNSTTARLVRMDWTLLLQGRETVSGVFDQEVLLPPGEPRDVPITVRVNLVEFFEGSAKDLVELALSLTGQGGAPKDVALRATPVIDTPLGPIRYPSPITIVSVQVGDD